MTNAKGARSADNLAINLYRVRNERGITIQRLAEELDVSVRMISYYESGKKQPRIETLILLSEALDVPIDDLLR